jgi:hypothetical protein
MICQACRTYIQSRLMLQREATSKKYRQVHRKNLPEWPEQFHASLREPLTFESFFVTSVEGLRTNLEVFMASEEPWGIWSTLPAGNGAPAQARRNHP